MDFFAGSGTTGHAVFAVNAADGGYRRFILVQLPEKIAGKDSIATITRDRLKEAGAAHASLGVDTGLRALRVDSTNLLDTSASPDVLAQGDLLEATDSVKPDRTDEDLLFQVLLDWGLDLAEPIEVEEIAGRRVLSVAADALVACFSNEVPDDIVKEIASRRPLRAVFLDAGFASDAARINAEQIFREVSPETEVRAI